MKRIKIITFYAGIRLRLSTHSPPAFYNLTAILNDAFCVCGFDVAVVAAVDDWVGVVAQLVSCVETGGQ